jgi:hypothetical protein
MTKTVYPADFCASMASEFASHALKGLPDTFDEMVPRALDRCYAIGFDNDGGFSYGASAEWVHPIWESLAPDIQEARESLEGARIAERLGQREVS